ncbi:MAG TPA: OmpH family outer membrane protein [Azospirillum sp.]|nr:OmpH family outer membrane protein [Azospirillum sp.]
MQFSNIRALAAATALSAAVLFPLSANAQQQGQKPAAQPAQAQPAPAATNKGEPLKAPVVAVVDVQRVMQESTASKGIQKTIESQRDTYQKEIQTLEDKLQNAESELRKQQTVLAPDAFAAKRRDFEKQVADVQRTVQARKRTLDTAFNDAMGHVQKTMLDIVQSIADERGANVVIPRNLLVLFASNLDVTDTVLERLNKQLPAVAVTIPKP